MTDEERMTAMQSWYVSADLVDGTITLRLPGIATGRTLVCADLRKTVDAAMAVERAHG